MFKRPVLATVTALLALASGCGAGDDLAPGESDTAALSEALIGDGATCSAASLDGTSSSTCAGPWVYKERVMAYGPDPSCGAYQCQTYWTCSAWQFGATLQHGGSATTKNQTCTSSCDFPSGENCSYSCSPTLYPTAWCNGLKNTKVAELIDAIPVAYRAQFQALVKVTPTVTAETISDVTTFPGRKKEINRVTTAYTCHLSWDGVVAASGAAPPCSCAIYGYPSCSHQVGEATSWSSPGLREAQLPAHLTSSCTTCDTLPFASDADVGNKHECLQKSLGSTPPAGVDVPALHAALVDREKLVYETRGDVLPESQRDQVRALYQESEAPVCSPDSPVSEACLATLPTQVAADLRRCTALTAVTTPQALRDVELAGCLGLLETVFALPKTACVDAARAAVDDTVLTLLLRGIDRITASPAGLVGLDRSLRDINDWYRKSRPLAGNEDPHLRTELDTVLAAFWRRAYGAVLPSGTPASDAAAAAMLAGFENQGLSVDWQVLSAAFADPAPMSSTPLLLLVADALRDTGDRVEQLTPLHDLGCAYASCGAGRSDQTVELWRILASLDDATRLGTAVAAATHLSSAHPDLITAFTRMRDRHAALAQAWSDAGGVGPVAGLATGALPAAARPLARLVRRARDVSARYQSQGSLFEPSSRSLYTGLDLAKQTDTVSLLNQRRGSLVTAREHWYADRLAAVTGALALLGNDQQGASLLRQANRLRASMRQRADDLAGLRRREGEAQATYADFWLAFEALRDAGIIDLDLAVDNDVLPVLHFAAGVAAYEVGGDRSLATLAIPADDGTKWNYELQAGDVLRVGVSGNWSPSCAITRSTFTGPGNIRTGALTDPVIGPEGYVLEWTGSSYAAHGIESSHTQSHSVSDSSEGCQGFNAAFSVVPDAPWSFSATTKDCHNETTGESWADSSNTTSGASSTYSARFATGLRSPRAPFDMLPVGALLMVMTDPENPSIIYDIRVVSRQSVVVAPRHTRVYLVANDEGGCIGSASELTVEMRRNRNFGAIAEKVAKAMGESLAEIAGEAPSVLDTGTFSAADQQLLRDQARLRLTEIYGAGVEVPEPVQQLFNTFLSHELASLERRTHIRGLEREFELSFMDLEALLADVDATLARSRLMALAPGWAMRRLAADETRDARDALAKVARDYVPPLMLVRFPAGFTAMRNAIAGQVDHLLDVDLAAPQDDVMTRLLDFGSALQNALADADLESSASAPVMVAVAFPRPPQPGASDPPPHGDPQPSGGDCNPLLGCLPPPPDPSPAPPPPTTPPPYGSAYWSTVNIDRATAAWQGLVEEKVGYFDVRPEDLYHPAGGNAVLVCSEAAPVITRMALFAVMPAEPDGLNGTSLRLDTRVADLGFPSGAGYLSFTPTPALAQLGGVRVYSGDDHEAVADFASAGDATGRGRSPLTTFRIDAHAVPAAKLAKVTSFVLVMEVETRSVPSTSLPVAECQ
jgi:hypothetical protein